eukprot:PITA_19094
MERTMLLAADLKPRLWREAVGTTVYTLNRTQLRPNCGKTPYELWKGRPASVDEDLPERETEEYEDDSLIEEEEPKEEEIDEEEEEEEEREPPNTPSKMKYVQRHHPEEQIIGDKYEGVQTRRRITVTPKRKGIALLSMIEPETFAEASKDPHWVKAMEEEMSQIEKNKTWELVPRPKDKNIIGSKWLFKNKMKEEG